MIYPELDINGMKTETDVCNMICDTIDDGNLSDAMDYVGQFKDYLVKKGISSERLTTLDAGPDQPAAPGLSMLSLAKNRRVEFIITK